MGQFAVHKNNNPKTRKEYPFLIDVQSDLLSDLQTRLAVPLAKQHVVEHVLSKRLTPTVTVNGESYLAVSPRMAGIEVPALGAIVANLDHCRDEIVAALDFLVTGI